MRDRARWLLPIGLAALYAAVLGYLAVQQRRTLFHFDEDLAIYDQVVWNTAHGRLFASTLIEHADNLLGDHFAPVVALFAPLYWLAPSANVLLLGQAVALGLAVLPLYAFARCRLGAVGALAVAVAYVAYPALHRVALFQFHEIALIVAPLMLALLALERGQRGLFLVAAVVCLTVKEEAAIVVAALGPLWWLRRRDARMAVATVVLGVIVGYLAMGVILPSLNTADAGSGYYYVRRYAYLGGTPFEVGSNAVVHPGLWLTWDRVLFALQLGAPLLFLPLIGWEYVVATLPVFAYLVLGSSPDQYSIDRHYLSPLVAPLFFGAVLGVSRLALLFRGALTPLPPLPAAGEGELRCGVSPHTLSGLRPAPAGAPAPNPGANGQQDPALPQEPHEDPVAATGAASATPLPLGEGRVRASLALLLVVASLVGAYVLRPAPVLTETDHTRELRRLIQEVPADASVAASRNLLSPFSRRERVYRFPVLNGADYVLLDFRELRHPGAFGLDGGAFGRLVDSPDYRMVDSAAGAVLFRRGDPGEPPVVGPGAPVRFGDAIDLLGARASRTDGGVEAILIWRATARVARQYTVFVHAFDAAGNRVAQADAPPVDGLMPTDTWAPGHVVVDRHRLTSPPTAVKLQIGLYDAANGRRLSPDAIDLPID